MSLFEKNSSTRCDLCGDDLGDSAHLDRHAGRHKGADPLTLKIGHMQEKKFKRHAESCACPACKWLKDMLAAQRKAHWERLQQEMAA